ncbi:glucan endo-1,3-beta-glucosidase-like [Tasmannia lanceolata]|uniref:glucan endo-1,3-beta-glucosidase-like n=1 Tax=Tasmannia lanceolata TaxID=3420 RepID=UPI004063260B
MEKTIGAISAPIVSLSIFLAVSLIGGVRASIGVNYGTIANDLPPPIQVARFLLQNTLLNRIKLYDVNPAILQAFAHTGIPISVTVANDQIGELTELSFAQQWVKSNILPYTSNTNIIRILVGNEVVTTANKMLIASLIPAMENLHAALVGASLSHRIKVSTAHSLGILSSSNPPSTGKFRRGYETTVFKPLLSFLKATNAPFMINPYPFFGFSGDTLNYALFRPNPGVIDRNTQLTYTNMLDGQLDAIYSAIKLLGFKDVDIVIAETGWPSVGDPGQVGVDLESAAAYNGNLVRHVTSGVGTPLMPNRTFETYIFSLFNENLKPGPTSERNFGLFRPDMTPVYDINGILRHKAKESMPGNPSPAVVPINPLPVKGKTWCMPKPSAESNLLQANIDYVCGQGVDCRPIQAGGACFLPNTVRAHAAYAMNAYFQATGRNAYDCDFRQTGVITVVDPSYGSCKYNS